MINQKIEKKCLACGNVFLAKTPKARYCNQTKTCKTIQNFLREKPESFEGISGHCSIHAANMDYYGPGYRTGTYR